MTPEQQAIVDAAKKRAAASGKKPAATAPKPKEGGVSPVTPTPATGEPPPLDWSQVPMKAAESLGQTAVDVGQAGYQAITQPQETAGRLWQGARDVAGAVAADPWGAAKGVGSALWEGVKSTGRDIAGTASAIDRATSLRPTDQPLSPFRQRMEEAAKQDWANRPISTAAGIATVVPVVRGAKALAQGVEAIAANSPKVMARTIDRIAKEGPSAEDVMTAKNIHYDDLRTNRMLDPHQWDRTWVKIKQSLDGSGFRESPQARAVVREMIRDRNPEGITFADAEKIHRMANDMLISPDGGIRRAGRIIKEHMDNYYDNAKATTPNFQEQVNVARDLGRSHILNEQINEIRRSAGYGKDEATSTINKIRSLAMSRRGKGYTPVEEAAIKQVIKEPGLLSKALGGASEWTVGQAGGLLGGMLGGPVGAALGGAGGFLGRMGIRAAQGAAKTGQVDKTVEKLQKVLLAGRKAQGRTLLEEANKTRAKRIFPYTAVPGAVRQEDDGPRPLLGR